MFQSDRHLRFRGLLLGLFLCAGAFGRSNGMPNIVVILTDDQGYGDISFNPNHPLEVSTPNMDSLAAEGVFFSQAYISGNVCSPTRAGLMLGRYQQRVGVYGAGEGGSGFDLSNHIFPWFLPVEYVSGAFGKWHLGTELQGWGPCDRGFDETYNFLGRGAHDYFDLDNPADPLYRCETVYPDIGYLTTRLTEEAVAFIDNHKTEPFFLYLAYNAVHSPAQAPQADIDYYSALYPGLSETRKILLAMLKHLDLGVGQVVQKLKDEGLWDNTLLFFLTDNGGAGAMDADCSPLRGNKGTNWEGGIRTPFVVSWPNEFTGGRTIDTPIISLDILPTVFDVLGMAEPNDVPFDGKSLMGLLREETTEHHQALYWGEGGDDGGWAIRAGDWKVIGFCEEMELYNLATDPYETTDVADQNPMKVVELAMMHDAWIDQMGEPIHNEDKKCAAYYALCQGFTDPYDYDDNCLVELPDLVTFLDPWLLPGGNDLIDFGSFSGHWFNSGLVGIPVADAGSDQVVQDVDENGSESFTLDGSGSYDPDGTIESYVWKENGSQIATGVEAVVEYPLGTFTFTLDITDDDGKTGSDTVDIQIIIPGLPHAAAGSDQSIEDVDENGTESVTLDGSGSYDLDGTIVSYVWKENGSTIATGGNPTISLPVGAHFIILEVTDNDAKTDTDEVLVNITSPYDPAKPDVWLDLRKSPSYEDDTAQARVRFLSSDPVDTLTVYFMYGGTAIYGTDYTANSSPVLVPPTGGWKQFTITAIDDSIIEGDETVRVILIPDSAYNLGDPAFVTTQIVDND